MTDALMDESGVTDGSVVFPRISTGNRQADAILCGGFPANSINIIMGQPGTGKTIFAEQLLFHNANPARPLLYLTTLSEPMSKVVSYAQRLGFFDIDQVGTGILYDDLGAKLIADGPAALVPHLLESIKSLSPSVVVIDSFKAIHDIAQSTWEIRRLVSQLAGVVSAYDMTVFLLGEYTQGDIEQYPEFAIADSIVQLERNTLGARDERYIRVLKLRGSGYSEGRHAFRITSNGLAIFPRLVTPKFESYVPLLERTTTGIDGLDEIMGGGVWRGSTTLVAGPTGSGKSTIGLQFALEAHRQGEAVLFVNFQENPAQVQRMIRALGTDPEIAYATGFHHLYRSPVELQIDSVIVEIFDFIETANVRRVVIDAVGDLSTAASDPHRLNDFLYSLVQHFVVRNVTTLLNLESAPGLTGKREEEQRWSYMSDNVLVLERAEGLAGERTIRVVKTRNSDHDALPHRVEIRRDGVHVV
ncbi:MAG TPA: ATPase domain-containing protein [Gemmatimonadaceae bacterium]|nr:ATPase domain-containing protein [Gemmatimonadaceae bacterium]